MKSEVSRDVLLIALAIRLQQLVKKLAMTSLAIFSEKRIGKIEHATNLEARTIFRAMKPSPPAGDPCEL